MTDVQAKAHELAGRIFGQAHYPVLIGPDSSKSPTKWLAITALPTGRCRSELLDLDTLGDDKGVFVLAAVIEALERKFISVRVFASPDSLVKAYDAARASQVA